MDHHSKSIHSIGKLVAFTLPVLLLVAFVLPIRSKVFPNSTVAALAATPTCDPGIGGRVFAVGGEVEVEILSPRADVTSSVYFFRGGQPPLLLGTNRNVGKVVHLGSFSPGSELVFGIFVSETGDTYKTGPASRNPDGIAHAKITCLDNQRTLVGFEDIRGGGDLDFDDAVIQVRTRTKRGITQQISDFTQCGGTNPTGRLNPKWGNFFGKRGVLESDAGEKLELHCVKGTTSAGNTFVLYYTPPGRARRKVGVCPFEGGCNSNSFTYTGDADGNGNPDRFIMTYWKSKDYGEKNDIPNHFTGATQENPPVLDHAISIFDATTNNLLKYDDKYQYRLSPPYANDSCVTATFHPEGSFLSRQLVLDPPLGPITEAFFDGIIRDLRNDPPTSVAMGEDHHSLADLNGDGIVNASDSQILQAALGTCVERGSFEPTADFDGDGCVTSVDQEIWTNLSTSSLANHAPVAEGKNLVVGADASCSAIISANDINAGSFDPDGDSITFALDSTGPFGLGEHLVTLIVTDSHGTSSSFVTTVTVVPLNITGLSVDKPVLWPPNHKLVNVTINYVSRNNCEFSSVSCALTVTSNEPVNDIDDDDTAPDWQVIDAHHVLLRAERSGNGRGRIYTITVTCTDTAGNSLAKSVRVRVPKSQGDDDDDRDDRDKKQRER